jgi:hypothetical protein
MEEYKDVMLSEPPARAKAGPAPAPAAAPSNDFSSYKGILLSDRPVDRAGAYGRGDVSSMPFLPSGKAGSVIDSAYVGLPPTLEQRSRMAQQHATVQGEAKDGAANGVVAKHRRWLKAFAANVRELQQSQRDATQQQQDTISRLSEREEQKRKAALDVTPAASSGCSLPPIVGPGSIIGGQRALNSGANNKKSKAKPVWAMTEDEAFDAEFEDARGLLDFAAALDYDTFAKDFEVREALAILRDRVKEIATEQHIDLEEARRQADADAEVEEVDAATAADGATALATYVGTDGVVKKVIRRPVHRVAAPAAGEAADRPEWNRTTNVAAVLRGAISTDALALAEKLLADSAALRQVHSKQSLARMLQDVVLQHGAGVAALPKVGAALAGSFSSANVPFEGRLKAPIVSSIAPDQGQGATVDASGSPAAPAKRILIELRKSKTQTQNLPYMYRCPLI